MKTEEPRKCLACGLTRIPDEQVVIEKKKTYIVYTCRCCKMRDIEEINEK